MNEFTKYLPYTLTLQAPAIIATISAEPNSARTLAYVPGNAVRGALAARLMATGMSAQCDEFQNLILGGRVRYLHAYPAADSTRALPTPIPWRREKGGESAPAFDLAAFTGHVDAETIWDDADGELLVSPEDVWPTKPLERKGIPAFVAFGSPIKGVHPRTDARVHQQRDRERGRSWKSKASEISHGAIFTYEFLEPDQEFRGFIQVFADSDHEGNGIIAKLTNVLEHQCVLLGRSRRAGYGGAATIAFDKANLPLEAHWGDVQQADIPAGRMFRLYLLSACIARNTCTGQIDPCALPDLVERHFGGREIVCVERKLWDFEAVGGFNRAWQLEVPQALAVRAGSILVLKAQQPVLASRLRELTNAGIGERRIEGFGRFVFLKHSGSQTVHFKNAIEEHEPQAKPSKNDPPELIAFLQRRILDAAVNRSLDHKAHGIIGKCHHPPTGSLLGRLRIPLRNGSPEIALNTLREWLTEPAAHRSPSDRTALKREARDKLAACQLRNGSLRDWISKNATATTGIELAREVFAKQHIKDSEFSLKVAEKRGAYYAVRLIDTVLAMLARMVRKERRSKP